jgi:hypothetical protein
MEFFALSSYSIENFEGRFAATMSQIGNSFTKVKHFDNKNLGFKGPGDRKIWKMNAGESLNE